jgi:hypothetical protein
MFSLQDDDRARDFVQKAVTAGVLNAKFTIIGQYGVKAGQEGTPEVQMWNFCRVSGQQNEIAALKAAIKGSRIEVHTGLDAGDVVPPFVVYKTIDGSEVTLNFDEADEKVYLLSFWANRCDEPIQHNQEMLEHHPEWEGRVEIVVISLDDDAESPQKRINEKGWGKVTSYWAGVRRASPTRELFEIRGNRPCLLVHKAKVLWRGDPSERKLAEDISGLIAGTLSSAQVEGAASYVAEPSKEDLEEKLLRVRALLNDFKAELPSVKTPKFDLQITKSLKQSGEVQFEAWMGLSGLVLKKYSERVNALQAEIKTMFPNARDMVEWVETYTITRAAACSRCANALTEAETQYISLGQADFVLCEACESTPGTGQGSYRLAHPYSMYVVQPGADRLDEILISPECYRDEALYEDEPYFKRHGCYCDNRGSGECEGSVEGIRWNCAHCKDYNFCDPCHSKWISAPSDRSKEEATKSGHFAWHVFIKKHFPPFSFK